MRAKMEQYKVDVRVDGKSGYSTMDLLIRKYLQDQQ